VKADEPSRQPLHSVYAEEVSLKARVRSSTAFGMVVSLAVAAAQLPVCAAEFSGDAERAGSALQSSLLEQPTENSSRAAPKNAEVSQIMKITIGDRVFTATLQNNATAAAFKALLPLTVEMHDVNRNEKAFDLPSDLPTADTSPRKIRTGDLMIWSSRTLVVFYESFSTSYRYTKLGEIADPAGLAEALGSGNVTVTFALQ
jgi:hypothetical protein